MNIYIDDSPGKFSFIRVKEFQCHPQKHSSFTPLAWTCRSAPSCSCTKTPTSFQVLAQLPLQSVLGHVVVSGEAIWMPTRIVHLGRSNMVQRHPGAVYFYAPGQ